MNLNLHKSVFKRTLDFDELHHYLLILLNLVSFQHFKLSLVTLKTELFEFMIKFARG